MKTRVVAWIILLSFVISCLVFIVEYLNTQETYAFEPIWAFNSQTLIYVCYKPNLFESLDVLWSRNPYSLYGDIPYSPADSEICRIDLEHNQYEQLTLNNFQDYHPRWSPDNNQIAFISNQNGMHHLHVMNAESLQEVFLTSIKGDVFDFTWAPSNRKIALSTTNGEIYTIDLMENKIEQMFEGISAKYLAWNPINESVIAYSVGTIDKCDTYIGNIVEGDTFSLAIKSDCVPIVWSPDGRFLAVVSSKDENLTNALIIFELSGNGAREIKRVKNAFINGSPVWSPDSLYIYYVSYGKIYRALLNTNDDDATQLGVSFDNYQLRDFWGHPNIAISPDGLQIVFALGNNKVSKLWKSSIDGTNLSELPH